MIELTYKPIEPQGWITRASQPKAGAVVLFLGITREFTADRRTVELTYEAYQDMAQKELERLELRARQRWPLEECFILHRLGNIAPGEASVAVVVSAAHRGEAFAAGQWLIDTLKETVPIWKRETWADGFTQWVHPGLDKNSSDVDATTHRARGADND